MPKAKKKTKGSASNSVVDPNDMDFWLLDKIKDYLKKEVED